MRYRGGGDEASECVGVVDKTESEKEGLKKRDVRMIGRRGGIGKG